MSFDNIAKCDIIAQTKKGIRNMQEQEEDYKIIVLENRILYLKTC